jgi:hypothetical protein
MTQNLYLKATTRAALVKALTAAKMMVDDLPAQGVLLDEIGAIEGVKGYHANLRFDATEEQIAALGNVVVAEPATPYRIWA